MIFRAAWRLKVLIAISRTIKRINHNYLHFTSG